MESILQVIDMIGTSLLVDEIFKTLNGEGKFSGYPTALVRLNGCNLQCSYCDFKSDKEPKRMTVGKVATAVRSARTKHVLITGGEPLIQEGTLPLVYELAAEGKIISIETNGCVRIEEAHYRRSFSYCMDIKCPSSDMDKYNLYNNLKLLQKHDEVKFVIGDYHDYLFAQLIIKKYPTLAEIILSPAFSTDGQHCGKDLAQWILDDNSNVRLGLQIHKICDFR